MTPAKYKLLASISLLFLLGALIPIPAKSTAPTWIEMGKYASYRGVYDEPMLIKPRDYLSVRVECSWNITSLTPSVITVSGLCIVAIDAYLNMTGQAENFYSDEGFETIQRNTSKVSSEAGFSFFGMEQNGFHTNLWFDNTSVGLVPSSTHILGHDCLVDYFSVYLPGTLDGTIIRYYDSDTGVLLALDLTGAEVTVGAVQWELSSSFVVSVNRTNAANIFTPTDYGILPITLGIGLAFTLILVIIFFVWRRRQQKRWLAAYARATTPVQ